MIYQPGLWMLIKITGFDPHYRVFATWRGGYTTGDSWRMNSGITGVKEVDGYYEFGGSTNSVYVCRKGAYGSSNYGYSIANAYVEKYPGDFEIIEDMPNNILEMDWIIK